FKLWRQFGSETPLVNDGLRIYFLETPYVSSSLMQVATQSGEASAISVPLSFYGIGDISPDHSSLLMHSVNSLWVMPLPAGTPHRIGNLHGHWGTWSPDGQHILFADRHDLYTARADGSESKKVAS